MTFLAVVVVLVATAVILVFVFRKPKKPAPKPLARNSERDMCECVQNPSTGEQMCAPAVKTCKYPPGTLPCDNCRAQCF